MARLLQVVLVVIGTACIGSFASAALSDNTAITAAAAAADKLADRCLDLGWQVNMSTAGAVGCEQLYQATGQQNYRDLAYIPLANTLLQAWLWEGDYGIGEHTTTFWAFSGCPAAPCSAEFENHRTRLALRQYLELAGKDLPPAVASMLEDGWKRRTDPVAILPAAASRRGGGHALHRWRRKDANQLRRGPLRSDDSAGGHPCRLGHRH